MLSGITDEMRLVIIAEVDRALRDMEQFDDQIEKTERTAKAASVNWDRMANRMMVFSAGVAAAGVASVKFAADLEAQEVAFGVLLGSVEKGTQIFAQLKQFSAQTPLQLSDITRGAQTLMAFGSEASDVQNELRMLGDAAMGDAAKLDSLVRAYGKLQAKGRASLEELNLFTENGVPIMKQLAAQTGATTEEVFALVSAGKIGFADVQTALVSLTTGSGKFAGMMEKISQTTTGKFSTAVDNLKLSAAELGAELLPMVNDLLDRVTKLAQWFTSLNEGTKKWILTLGGIAVAVGPIAKIGTGLLNVYKQKKQILSIASKLGPVITNPWVLAGAAVAALTIASIKLAQTWRTTRSVIEGGSTGNLGKDLEILSQQIDSARAKIKELQARQGASAARGGAGAGLVGFDPEQLKEAEERLEQLLQRRQAVAEQYRAEEYQKRVEAGEILWMENAFKVLDDAAAGQTKTWQAWFNEIAGTAFDEGTTTGKAFASAYLASLQAEMAGRQTLANAMGTEYDAIAEEAEAIRGVLEKLFSIDPDEITEPFTVADQSVKVLITRYKELTGAVNESVEEQVSLYNKMFEEEYQSMSDRLVALQTYGLVSREIADALVEGDTERLSILAAMKYELEQTLGIYKETAEVVEDIGELESGFSENWSPADQATDFGKFVRKALAGYDDITSAIDEYSFAIDILSDTWDTLWGTLEHNSEAELEAMETLVEEEYSTLQTALDNRESLYLEEIDALKEMYDSDVITYDEYLAQKAALDSQYETDTASEAATYVEMQNALLKAQYEAEVESFELEQTSAIIQATIAGALGIMQAWALGPIAGAVGSLLIGGATIAQIAMIRKQTPPAEPTYITAADVTAATGADFITSGPTSILAGENPGGKEHVQITPLSSPNIDGPQGGGDTFYISGNLIVGSDGMDEFIEKLEKRKSVMDTRGSYS